MIALRFLGCWLAPLLVGCHAVIGFDDELDFGDDLDALSLGTCSPMTLKGVPSTAGVPSDDDFASRSASENAWRVVNGVTGTVVSWCDAGKLTIEPHFERQWWSPTNKSVAVVQSACGNFALALDVAVASGPSLATPSDLGHGGGLVVLDPLDAENWIAYQLDIGYPSLGDTWRSMLDGSFDNGAGYTHEEQSLRFAMCRLNDRIDLYRPLNEGFDSHVLQVGSLGTRTCLDVGMTATRELEDDEIAPAEDNEPLTAIFDRVSFAAIDGDSDCQAFVEAELAR